MINNFNIPCGYAYDHLASEIYLAPSDSVGIEVDNGAAYAILGTGTTLTKIDCFNIKLEDTSEFLEERYQFTHSLTFSVNGYANLELADEYYYYIVRSKSGEYFVVNPNFPSKLTYTYTLDGARSVTTFTAATASNFPVLLLTNTEDLPAVTYEFDYINTRLLSIKMIERENVMFFEEFAVYTDNEGFSDVDYLKKTASFTERFDGTNLTHTLQFNIPFSERGTSVSAYSWNYRLLEFQNNKYAAVVKDTSGNYFMSGFEYGLQPSFTVNATSTKDSSYVTVALTEVYSSGIFSENIRNLQIIKYGDPMVRTTSGTPYCNLIRQLLVDVTASTSTDLGITWTTTYSTEIVAQRSNICPLKDIPLYLYNSGSSTASFSWNAQIQTSTNNVNWTTLTENATTSIPSGVGRYYRIPSNMQTPPNYKLTYISGGTIILCGNIMSLLYQDFTGHTSITRSEAFKELFKGCTNIVQADRLILPAMTLTSECYYGMFSGCTALTTAPELPATTLATGCYVYMFNGCISLSQAPVLPATTLSQGCYDHMFVNCIALTTAPVLPAQTLIFSCYANMFSGCANLNYIKCLAKTLNYPMQGTISNWTSGVASSGSFIKRADTDWPYGTASGIPNGWTIINE